MGSGGLIRTIMINCNKLGGGVVVLLRTIMINCYKLGWREGWYCDEGRVQFERFCQRPNCARDKNGPWNPVSREQAAMGVPLVL